MVSLISLQAGSVGRRSAAHYPINRGQQLTGVCGIRPAFSVS